MLVHVACNTCRRRQTTGSFCCSIVRCCNRAAETAASCCIQCSTPHDELRIEERRWRDFKRVKERTNGAPMPPQMTETIITTSQIVSGIQILFAGTTGMNIQQVPSGGQWHQTMGLLGPKPAQSKR